VVLDIIAAIRFSSPLLTLIAGLIALVVLYQYSRPRRHGTIAATGLEYLVELKSISKNGSKPGKAAIQVVLISGLALLWAGPEYYSTKPLLEGDTPGKYKKFIVALDISPSMNLPSDVTGYGEEDLKSGEEGVTRFEMARKALVDFLERFRGQQFGLVLFSTEPLLARWPTTDTANDFVEVLESIRRGSNTQLSAFSSLTNIDKGLAMAKLAAAGDDAAIILISDAEDHLENIGVAVSELRQSGIRLYVIGVGISETVIATLSEQFTDDPGFRIFRAASEQEMEEAYGIVGSVEESPALGGAEQFYRVDLGWVFALAVVTLSIALFWLSETRFHTTVAADHRSRGPDFGDRDV
jgi:hypothetical protein